MAGLVQRQNGNRQTGCMSSFLQIFDRQQILAGKRIHSTKRLPPSSGVGASPETVSSGYSPKFYQKLGKLEPKKGVMVMIPANPGDFKSSPAKNVKGRQISPTSNPTDVNQSQPRCLVARLMGLEPLTSSDRKPPVTVESPALPRSVHVRSKFIDGDNFQVKQPNQLQKQSVDSNGRVERSNRSSRDSVNGNAGKSMENEPLASESLRSEASRTYPWRSGRLFHSGDFFPEQNQTTVIMNGDLEKKLKTKGMDEHFNDLNALKQILEVLQLKGLLHPTTHRNFVYDRNLHSDESSIHLNQWRSLASKLNHHRSVNDSRGTCRYASESSSDISPKLDGRTVDRNCRIPVKVRMSSSNPIESNLKSCNSIIKSKPLSIQTHSPITKKPGSVHHSITNRSPRNHKPTESSSINSPNPNIIKNIVTDDELQRSTRNFCEEGKRLLVRCDKLLHSIAEMNSAMESPPSSATVLPSPVSVLDSGFDKDESSSSSHSIDFKATPTFDFEEDWSPKISATNSKEHEEFISDDSDFIYISEILESLQNLQKDPNIFYTIEKQLYNDTEHTSNVSKRHRKLVFDVIVEIFDRNRQLPPWKSSIQHSLTSIKHIWSEFQKIRDINTGICVSELISDYLKKDLVEIKDWGEYPIESSEAILEIERMVFKDLVSEMIGEFVNFSGECVFSRTRRRLVF
ncbi:hypothetical protein R6Q59_036679 [Mikania micrantha]|uniref:DUF4378 domain-containing protein n=1 Tax=Mikania micrantha TaxID=192012 RepID=A0A5N6N9P3_9ASTR|nr:hypothetical protein E3N88_22055 [Mikania micrantha]